MEEQQFVSKTLALTLAKEAFHAKKGQKGQIESHQTKVVERKSKNNSGKGEMTTYMTLFEKNISLQNNVLGLRGTDKTEKLPIKATHDKVSSSVSKNGHSKRQWITLILFGSANLFCGVVYALQAPFYPFEAEKKGATATEYGFVFGVYELIMILASPIFGKYINKLGPRLMFNVGICTTAISCILFGLLDKIDNHMWFILLSLLLRIIEAVGCSSFLISTYTLIASEFPDSVSSTFATLETLFGLGLIVGPAAGGALYELGGYTFPFAAIGCCLIALGISSIFIMPKIKTVEDENGNATEGYGIFSILKIPSVLVATLCITITASTSGFLSATLEPHLRQFSLNHLQTGLMFVINGGIYAIFALAFGWICDRTSKLIYMKIFGILMIFSAFLLIGPAPFIPMKNFLWVTGLGLFIQGIGIAAIYVSGFVSALRGSIKYGFPDNVSTYGVLSGLWISSLSVGSFIGPSIGGALLDNFGFRNATWFPLICPAIMAIILLTHLLKSQSQSVKKAMIADIESNA